MSDAPTYETIEEARAAMARCMHKGAWRVLDSQFSTYEMARVYVGVCQQCGFTGRVPPAWHPQPWVERF